MNIPNALTLSRIVLAIILIFLLQERTLTGNILSAIVFAMASLTDFYDGHLAKKRGLVSDFGKIMDPVADKFLLLSVFAVLAHLGLVAWWIFIVIALREVLVTVSRLWAMSKGRVLAAERAGKIKTVVQIIAVSAILLYLVACQTGGWFTSVKYPWMAIDQGLLYLAVLLTIYSGIDYFRNKN